MKVTRIICSHCHQELDRVKTECDNLTEYKDSVEYKLCPRCKTNPAAKLVVKILGKGV